MRKIAFRIMCRTYGAKKKDTGEPIYDAYPLKTLAQVLCFEDLDEARAACMHYNITVKPTAVRAGGQTGTLECVLWRHSDFKEAKDPTKGTILPLRPRKMVKYIESKLRGTTRLAVCRGEASGEGSSLSTPPAKTSRSVNTYAHAAPSVVVPPPVTQPVSSSAAAADDELRKRQEEHAKTEARKMEEKRAKLKAEQDKRRLEREMEAKRQSDEDERQKLEEKWQAEELARLKAAEEARLAEESRRVKEQEETRIAEEARLEEERRRLEEERQHKLQEEARKKAEAEETERQRVEALQREMALKKAEAEEQERQRLERLRRERETKRLEAVRLQEEEKRRQEALERKAALELEQRVDNARKLLLLRRWRQLLPRSFKSRQVTRESLKRIDPTFSVTSPFTSDFDGREVADVETAMQPKTRSEEVDIRKVLNRILAKPITPLGLPQLLLEVLCGDESISHEGRSNERYRIIGTEAVKSTFLFKLAVVLPQPQGLEEESMYESIHTWLNRRIEYGNINVAVGRDASGVQRYEVRVLCVKADSLDGSVTCDAALFVMPPSFCTGDGTCSRKIDAVTSAFECISPDVPRIVYALGESFDEEYINGVREFLAECLPNDAPECPVVFPGGMWENALESALESSLSSIVRSFAAECPPLIEQVSVVKLAAKCITGSLWKESAFDSLESARAALRALVEEIDRRNPGIDNDWSSWPSDEFATVEGYVTNYFCEGVHLPVRWAHRGFREKAKLKLLGLHQSLDGTNVASAISKLLVRAPLQIRRECEEFLERKHYRKCIQLVMECGCIDDEILFLPRNMAEEIAAASVRSIIGSEPKDMVLDEEAEKEGGIIVTEDWSSEAPQLRGDNIAVNASDDAGVFKKARDIFSVSRTVSPVPGTSATPLLNPMQSPPISELPPPPISSGYKRSWTPTQDKADDDEMVSPLRSPFGYPYPGPGSSLTKRRRDESYLSRDETESSAYTRKLQALLKGEAICDMDIGTTKLSTLVRNAAPLADLECISLV
jgi:hypothetical protein